jgi:hypothetical protein
LSNLESADRSTGEEEVVQWINSFQGIFGFDKMGNCKIRREVLLFWSVLWFETQVLHLVSLQFVLISLTMLNVVFLSRALQEKIW